MKLEQKSSNAAEDIAYSLTTRELLAQLIMIDIPDMQKIEKSFIDSYKLNPWGGIILFARNIDNESQLKSLTSDLRELSCLNRPNLPIFIAVDQEGGIVTRFSFDSTTPLCGNMALGAAMNPEYAYQSGKICAQDLVNLGINTNFAPDLDVNNNPRNPIIGARSFGESPESVSLLGRAFIRGQREFGVISSAKHFPGHGDTSIDPHSELSTFSHSLERLESIEIIPFKAAIEEKVEMIMTSHITFPALEPERGLPATLSKKILTDYLRNSLGYEGVIITDSMSMKAVTENFGYAEAAVKALTAGADMLLLCGTPEQQTGALDALEKVVMEGRIEKTSVVRSFCRLYDLRKRFLTAKHESNTDTDAEKRKKMLDITLETITLVKNEMGLLPINVSENSRILLVMPSLFPPSPLGEAKIQPTLHLQLKKRIKNLDVIEYNVRSGLYEAQKPDEKANLYDAIVFASFCNGRLPVSQKSMIEDIFKINEKIILVSLNSPYVLMDVPMVPAYVNCYNYGIITIEALSMILFGEKKPAGKLPVSLPGLYQTGYSISYD